MMTYKLKMGVDSEQGLLEFPLDRTKTLLGRYRDNHIRIRENFVSGHHAEFIRGNEGELFLEDCGSKNGVYINGQKVEGIVELNDCDKIQIGEIQGSIHRFQATITETPEEPTHIHHSVEKSLPTDLVVDADAEEHIDILRSELDRLSQYKHSLKSETEELTFQRDQLSKDHDELMEDLLDARKKVEELIDLECDIRHSIDDKTTQKKISRKKVFSRDEDNIKCATTEKRICRAMIRWMEELEEAQKETQQSKILPKLGKQIFGLKDSFEDMLEEHSVSKVDPQPGEKLTMSTRHKLQLIAVDEIEDAKLRKEVVIQEQGFGKDVVLRTLSPGFVYIHEGKEHVLRKAEVVVS